MKNVLLKYISLVLFIAVIILSFLVYYLLNKQNANYSLDRNSNMVIQLMDKIIKPENPSIKDFQYNIDIPIGINSTKHLASSYNGTLKSIFFNYGELKAAINSGKTNPRYIAYRNTTGEIPEMGLVFHLGKYDSTSIANINIEIKAYNITNNTAKDTLDPNRLIGRTTAFIHPGFKRSSTDNEIELMLINSKGIEIKALNVGDLCPDNCPINSPYYDKNGNLK